MATRAGLPELAASRQRQEAVVLERYADLPTGELHRALLPISAGGRLSTTKYPRSSRHFAASDRPAPDRPVMMVKSRLRLG